MSKDGTNIIIAALLGTRDHGMVEWLTEHGVDVNYCKKYDLTAAFLCCSPK